MAAGAAAVHGSRDVVASWDGQRPAARRVGPAQRLRSRVPGRRAPARRPTRAPTTAAAVPSVLLPTRSSPSSRGLVRLAGLHQRRSGHPPRAFVPAWARRRSFVLADHHALPEPAAPLLEFPAHAAAVKLCAAADGPIPVWPGQILVALFGDERPMTAPAGPARRPGAGPRRPCRLDACTRSSALRCGDRLTSLSSRSAATSTSSTSAASRWARMARSARSRAAARSGASADDLAPVRDAVELGARAEQQRAHADREPRRGCARRTPRGRRRSSPPTRRGRPCTRRP